MFAGINLWAVLVGTILVFILGIIWYSPRVFGTIGSQEATKPGLQLGNMRHGGLAYVAFFLLALLSALAFAILLGPYPMLGFAIYAGVIAGVCWVATSFGISYLFTNRGWKAFLIDSGYHILQFIIYGLVLGFWH